MALRGNLRDFSLPDVFQLVTLSGKSGILRIKRADGAEGGIWFRDGEVFFAQSNWHREPLGERLVEAGRLTPAALAKSLGIQQAEGAGGRRLGQVLVDEGYLADKVLESFVQEQIQDTIFDLMRWDEGDFGFEDLTETGTEDIGLSVSIENIVMEGSRRLEEWNRIKKKIPSVDIVFKMATAPGEGTFEISLKPIEWNLLLLVDGTRTVSQLATDTNRTDFEVARVLYGLFSAGLLEVAADEEVERLRAERAQLESRHAAQDAAASAPAFAEPQIPAPDLPVAPVAEVPAAAVDEAPAGYEPEMPAFLSGQAQAAATDQDMAVFEQMLGAVLTEPGQPSAAPPAEAPPIEPPAVEAVPEQAPPIPEAPVVVEPMGARGPFEAPQPIEAQTEGPEKTGDFARDLMALGLGELPSEDLLAPMGEVQEAAEVFLGPEAAQTDLGALLGSLEADGEEPTIAEIEHAALVQEVEAEEPGGGVISTDAFMAEFDEGGMQPSGFTDELTALTGGAAPPRRPAATVNKIPEPGQEGGLHMDQHVDKALVMKIIEGIEKL